MEEKKINKVVIHALVKEQHKKIEKSVIKEAVLDKEDVAVKKTVDGIVGVYGTRANSAHYGVFKNGEGRGSFPDNLIEYSKIDTPSDHDFIKLTKVAMDRLYEQASMVVPSSGGYILFSDYTDSSGRFFLISMIKKRPGIALSEALKPEVLMELDLSRLHQAARINFGKLSSYLGANEDDKKSIIYLSFVSPSANKTTAGYFVTALGCSEGAASAQAMKTVLAESKAFFNKNKHLAPHAEALGSAIKRYYIEREHSGDSIKLTEVESLARKLIPTKLSDQADKLMDEYISRLNSDECGVPAEFPVHSYTLKRLTHISGKTSSWSTEFDKAALGDTEAADVYYDESKNRLILRDVPQKLKEEILAEIKKNSGEGAS